MLRILSISNIDCRHNYLNILLQFSKSYFPSKYLKTSGKFQFYTTTHAKDDLGNAVSLQVVYIVAIFFLTRNYFPRIEYPVIVCPIFEFLYSSVIFHTVATYSNVGFKNILFRAQ